MKVPDLRGRGMNLRDFLGVGVVSGFMVALFLLFKVTVPQGNKDLITYMLGQLSGFVGGVMAAHYTIKAGQEKLDAQRAENTGKALEALGAAVNAVGGDGKVAGASAVADAAVDEADRIAAHAENTRKKKDT